MLRLYPRRIFAAAAFLILGVTLIRIALKIEVPLVALGVLFAVCLGSLFGTLYTHGSGRLEMLPPDSVDEQGI